MEKYTSLEQALSDSSLVLITDSITTLKELNRAFAKYRVIPKQMRRISNYYSNEFLGHNVPEMYALVKEQIKESEDLHLPSDKYVVSEPDLYYKEESFNSGDTNICFLLGHSGSGKSVMARTLEGDDIDHIELDDLLLVKDHFAKEDLNNYSDMFAAFFDGEGSGYYIGIEERDNIPKEEYEDRVFIDFVNFAMDYAKDHKRKKYILDGIWIYLYFDDPSLFKDYTVFIKGTSFLKSKIRVAKREHQRDREDLEDRRQMFGRETRNYLLDEDKIDSYRNYYGNLPETVFKSEENEITKENEKVINELNNINRCFVNDDADGIVSIMKKAETDDSLSRWNRLRITNDCKAALIEMR